MYIYNIMHWEKYTHAQLKELALKYNHIVGIKNVNKLSRRELESELSKHLEVSMDSMGKHTVTIKAKSETWRPRTDVGEEEAKRAYAKVKDDVIGVKKAVAKMEEKKEKRKYVRKTEAEKEAAKEKKAKAKPRKKKD